MKITLEQAEEISWGDSEEFPVVHIEKGDDRRWSRTDEIIIEVEGRFYKLLNEVGLTEGQGFSGAERFPQCSYGEKEFELPEVFKHQKEMVKVWYE